MKPLLILSLLFLSVVQADSTSASSDPDDLEWVYTLAVQNASQQFSFSLMKDGWLAFDTWGDDADLKESRSDLSAEQFALLKAKFDTLFERIRTSNRASANEVPSYAFERVGDHVTTLEFSGHYQDVVGFIEWLSLLSDEPLPFSLSSEGASSGDTYDIGVTADGVVVQGQTLSLEELKSDLTTLSLERKLLIRVDPALPLKEFNSVFELCSSLGFKHIAMANLKVD